MNKKEDGSLKFGKLISNLYIISSKTQKLSYKEKLFQ